MHLSPPREEKAEGGGLKPRGDSVAKCARLAYKNCTARGHKAKKKAHALSPSLSQVRCEQETQENNNCCCCSLENTTAPNPPKTHTHTHTRGRARTLTHTQRCCCICCSLSVLLKSQGGLVSFAGASMPTGTSSRRRRRSSWTGQQNHPTVGDESHLIAGKEEPALTGTTPQPICQSYADGSVRHTGRGLLCIEEAGVQREAPLQAPGRRPTAPGRERFGGPSTGPPPFDRQKQPRDFPLHGHSPPPLALAGLASKLSLVNSPIRCAARDHVA